MAEPPEKTIKRLFALSGNICAYPECDLPIVEAIGTVTGEICHINASSVRGPRYDPMQREEDRHGFGNLILLCRRHHKLIDAEPHHYSVEILQGMKARHEQKMGRAERATDIFFVKTLLNSAHKINVLHNAEKVAINSPGAILADSIYIKTSSRRVSVNAPPGTIGANQQLSRYIAYLITRYNKFASADYTRATKFRFAAISGSIERQFGAPWKLLPADQFEIVCEYLKQRINRTIVAKLNASKGHPSFSTYQEFLSQ